MGHQNFLRRLFKDMNMPSLINFLESEKDYQNYLAVKNRDRVAAEESKRKWNETPLADKIGNAVKSITSPLEKGAQGITRAMTGVTPPKAEATVPTKRSEDAGFRDIGASKTGTTPTPVQAKVEPAKVAPPVSTEKPKVYDNPLASNTKLNTAVPITKRLATVSNVDKMAKAKSDAANAALAYKKNNPDWDKDTKLADASDKLTPAETERKTAYVSPQADTTSSLAKMTPTETARKFDYASAAGSAVNSIKKAGSSLIDKVKEEAPGILNRGKQVLASLSGTGLA
jgi:hypothetical protein